MNWNWNKKYKPLIKTINYELKPKNPYQKLSFQHYEIQTWNSNPNLKIK